MDQRYTYTQIEDQLSRFRNAAVGPNHGQSLTPVPEEMSGEEEDDQYVEDSLMYDDDDEMQGQQPTAVYEPLPAIDSGEPLQWEPQAYEGSRPDNPFRDSYVASSHHSHESSYESDHYSTTGIRYLDPNSRPVSTYSAGPSSAHSSYSGHNQYNTVPQNYTGYTATSSVPAQTTGYSHYTYQSAMPTGTTEYQGVDHFQHDTEAYASGVYARGSSYPRSRSPTPAVDDEDYHVVANDSIHYTGNSPLRNSRYSSQDPEKANMQDDIGAEGYYELLRQTGLSHDPEKSSLSTSNSNSHFEPTSPVTTRHFGPAPIGRVHRRNKLKKRVQLTNGNLVVDLDVPPKMVLPRREPEMMKTRYTAVTCDPDDFEKKGFFLRQNEYGRTTELFIVITMYNVCALNKMLSS